MVGRGCSRLSTSKEVAYGLIAPQYLDPVIVGPMLVFHSLRKMSTFGFGNICPNKIWTILPQKVDKMSHFEWAESSISDMDL
jgi:Na+/H+ antiporter NhaB